MLQTTKMRKNGKFISFRQYKYVDLFFWLIALGLSELLFFCAYRLWFQNLNDKYFINFMLPIVLAVIMRWGWIGGIYAVADGVILCAAQEGQWQSYIVYIIGCACILAVLLLTKFMGKEKIRSKWYFSLLYVFVGWVAVNIGLTCAGAAFGGNFLSLLGGNFGLGVYGAPSFATAIALVMIFRRMDGFFEDQKHYLLRQDRERRELAARDEFGDEPIEIDEETLSILRRRDDGLD